MDPRGYAGACAVLRDVDLATILPTVRCRTLVVTGAQDPLLPQDTGQATVRQLANGEHVRLACGHFPPLEAPQDFASELRRWFASASASAAVRHAPHSL
jgi:pimeloyl-ACP methyl ester carboxylesterase